ncbi:RNA polymerase sigma factor [Virgibacillus doumboii]|uniref:RNA polymerase sigma factor n=1 Tax=Virgibacillus doumboii TaxID=2697503 RepID=UPI0013E04ED6|nr:RNA polymerase sigma factor [Virgibacillus doumboii]
MEEEDIISLAKAKDEQAFEWIVKKYKPVIEKFAFQFGIKQEYISDVVQETFIKVYRKIHLYHQGKFSTWVYQITLNVARDFHRRKKRNLNIMKNSVQLYDHSIGYLFEKEEHLLLHDYIQKLEQKYKLPIILYYFHDKPYDEIAIILNIKLSVVKTRIYRGKKRLKQMYEPDLNEEVKKHG